jgi:hypothetical protein
VDASARTDPVVVAHVLPKHRLEFEVLSRRRFATKAEARREVARFID